MGSDMVVALPPTTVDGATLFGQNCTRPASCGMALVREPGRAHPPGEMLRLHSVALPQARQTFTVLGLQAAGTWGFLGGVNEQHVMLGQTAIRTRLAAAQPELTGSELARLALERGGSARQAVECLTDLVSRHGQGDDGNDHAFLVADKREAYVVETAGEHWAVQEINAVRAVSEVCLLHQDWDHISRGLADVAISRKWWPGDGSKLSFAGVVAPDSGASAGALHRWGQATLLLEQQSGRIDAEFVRRVLCKHIDGATDSEPLNELASERSLCRLSFDEDGPVTAASLVVEYKAADAPVLAWCAFGPPALSIYFPVFLDAELPPAFQAERADAGCALWRRLMPFAARPADDEERAALRDSLAALQTHFDHHAKETFTEAMALKNQGDAKGLQRLLNSFMQANVERFEDLWTSRAEPRRAAPRSPASVVESSEEFAPF